jgi:hypothetical protein
MSGDAGAAPVRFATFLAPDMYDVYEAIAAYVARALGRNAILHVGRSFDEFEMGEADFGFI